MSHGGLSSRVRLDGPAASGCSDEGGGGGEGEGELRSRSMSHIERGAGCSADVGPGLVVASGWSGSVGPKAVGGSVGAGGAIVGADVAGAVPASALVVPVRNGRSNASLSLETFFGPNPGSCASCAASACAILAKLCAPVHKIYREERRIVDAHRTTRAGSRRRSCSRAGCS